MNIRQIINEPRRGCGYRKPGGMYLMADGPAAPCGKLPLPLTVCPVCHQGIKPARGWTWIDPRPLFKDRPCDLARLEYDMSKPAGCLCVLNNPPERMGLLWIGERFYPTPADFIKEGMAQGISRRIAAVPVDFKVGETWVLFAHRYGMSAVINEHTGEVAPIPAINGCFLPRRLEYIVRDDDTPEKLERLEKRGITLVRLVRTDISSQMDQVEQEAKQE